MHRPFYRVLAADSKSPRDGKHLEVLGYYDPLAGKDSDKRLGLKFDRVEYWLSVGAQPSDSAQRILFRAGILTPPLMGAIEHKGESRNTYPYDPVSGCYLTPEKLAEFDQLKDPEGDGDNTTTQRQPIIQLIILEK